jgi:hypothetical protein
MIQGMEVDVLTVVVIIPQMKDMLDIIGITVGKKDFRIKSLLIIHKYF